MVLMEVWKLKDSYWLNKYGGDIATQVASMFKKVFNTSFYNTSVSILSNEYH